MKSVQIPSFFWSVFSSIRTEYGDLLRKSQYSVQMQENTDQKELHIWTLFTLCLLHDSISMFNVCRTCLVVSYFQRHEVWEVLLLINFSKSGCTLKEETFAKEAFPILWFFAKVFIHEILDLVPFAKLNSDDKFLSWGRASFFQKRNSYENLTKLLYF